MWKTLEVMDTLLLIIWFNSTRFLGQFQRQCHSCMVKILRSKLNSESIHTFMSEV